MLSKVLGRKQGYVIGMRNAILWISLQRKEERSPDSPFPSSSGSPLPVMFAMLQLDNTNIWHLKLFLLVKITGKAWDVK